VRTRHAFSTSSQVPEEFDKDPFPSAQFRIICCTLNFETRNYPRQMPVPHITSAQNFTVRSERIR
jgi:hypothetical protein